MTVGDILLGLLIACGFFLSAAVGRIFRRRMSGIVFGGFVGIAFSVTVLVYGLNNVFAIAEADVAN